MKGSSGKRPVVATKSGVSSFRICYSLVGGFVLITGFCLLYASLFRRSRRPGPAAAAAVAAPLLAPSLNRGLGAPSGGIVASGSRDECGRGDPSDPDAWLDYVAEKECYPKITPSWYAQVHGIEPFERGDLKPFELHTYPTDDWYDLAKKATDRCDLELHEQIVGGDKGMADDVVWVSGLFDLKRGESGNKDFQRPMEEYYRRFQVVLDRGAFHGAAAL